MSNSSVACLTALLVSLTAGCGASQRLPAVDGGLSPADRPPDAAAKRAVDILFMVDNSSEMTAMQEKLVQQLPMFLSALASLPGGLPDVHIAVVSSDMGAPGDSTASIGCTAAGDQGIFHVSPRGSCTASGLQPGASFISNVGGIANYTGSLADALTCIALLGSAGCGFEHQLASVVRGLGADGTPPPAQNVGFLRPDAELAIFLLTNEDDCSAPADTTLYSLKGAPQSLSNPLGPIQNYRCNQFGHLCKDPTGAQPEVSLPPPLTVPSDATGDPPKLALTDCTSDDGPDGLLTPLATFLAEIKALKPDPSRIVAGAVIGPTTPYTVAWIPAASPPPGTSSELWPFTLHSCGGPGSYGPNPGAQTSTDGTFGDPGVRVRQWVEALGGVTGSVCDPDYAAALQSFAGAIGQHL